MSILALFRSPFSHNRSAEDAEARIAVLEDQIRNRPHRAQGLHNSVIRLAAQHGLSDLEARHQYQLGLLHRASGKARKAEGALARAAEIWTATDNPLCLGDAHLARAGVCLMDRRIAAAQDFADQAREQFSKADALSRRPQLTRLLSAIAAMRTAPRA